MSAITDQTLVLLATEAGCLETLRQTNAFARVDIRAAIADGFAACQKAIIEWPGMCNRCWVKDRREQFQRFIESHPDRGYSAVALACMCERINADLLQRDDGVARKMALLEPIAAASRKIHDFCDREGLNFPAYEKGDELLDELYRIIELREFV